MFQLEHRAQPGKSPLMLGAQVDLQLLAPGGQFLLLTQCQQDCICHRSRIVGREQRGGAESRAQAREVRQYERPFEPDRLKSGPVHDVRVGAEHGNHVRREQLLEEHRVVEPAREDGVVRRSLADAVRRR